MIYSCLVDADFLNAESVMAPEKAARRGGYPDLAALHEAFNAFMARKTAAAEPGNVNKQRAKVLAACREAALLKQGLFSLTVPTGGGKTLSSLAFALAHAAGHSLRRIIYVIPYTSIIEQTADVFREAFGAAFAHAVIEHHSNVEEKAEKNPEEADQHEDVRTLAFENWDAPIIVTTAVQFFESLFAARSSRCRKLHNIAGSVIVLDEAQTLPTSLFRPCLAAIRELSGTCRASVVLCTATQPEVGIKPWNRNGLEGVREIAPDPPELFRALERVRVKYLGSLEPLALAQRLAGHERALCIVNTRAQARYLCELLRGSLQEGQTLFHLSTRMCPAHRRAVLARIKAMLDDPAAPSLLVVSTSLVEAGVDLDFPVVYRAMAGVDSIAQAAGRCNREGRMDWGCTYVFSFPEPLRGEQARRKSAADAVLRAGLPLLSPEAVTLYFDELHSTVGADGLDKPGILRRVREHATRGLFPFRSVERKFRFIEENELPLIIPYNAAARESLDALRAGRADRGLYRRLQQWIVGVPEKIIHGLPGQSVAAVGFAGQHYELINRGLYNGLEEEKADAQKPALGLDTRNPDDYEQWKS
jgi:CRISPR-associated endonuclease/helicase Cas3